MQIEKGSVGGGSPFNEGARQAAHPRGFFYGQAQQGRESGAASFGRSTNPLLPGHPFGSGTGRNLDEGRQNGHSPRTDQR